MAKEKLLKLNRVLSALDNNDVGFYDTLTPDEQKEFSAWLIMRYSSSSGSAPENNLIMTNELVNSDFSALSKHPKLQWMLLSQVAVCGGRHDFIPPAKKGHKDVLSEMISTIYPFWNSVEVHAFLEKNEKGDIKDLLIGYGFDEKTIKTALTRKKT